MTQPCRVFRARLQKACVCVCVTPWLPARWRCSYSAFEPQLQMQLSKAAWIVQTGPRPRLHTNIQDTQLTHISDFLHLITVTAQNQPANQNTLRWWSQGKVFLASQSHRIYLLSMLAFQHSTGLWLERESFKVQQNIEWTTKVCIYLDRPWAGAPVPCRRWSDISCRSDSTGCLLPGRRSARSDKETRC